MTTTMTGRQRHKPFTPSGHFGLKKSDTQADTKVLRLLPTYILKNNFYCHAHLAHLLLFLFIFYWNWQNQKSQTFLPFLIKINLFLLQ